MNLDLTNIKGLLTDIDNTLYAYEPAHRAALAASYDRFRPQAPVPFDNFATRYASARKKVTERLHPQGACRSRLFAFQIMCEEAEASAPYLLAYDLDQIYWDVFLHSMTPCPAAAATLDACFSRNIPVCAVTDMTAHVQIRKLERLGLSGRITHLVTSEEIGCEKPDARMFRAALGKLGVAATDAIMIGDDPTKDISGAEACGIKAYLYSAG